MTLAVFTKRNGSLVPVDEEGRELLAKIKEGREVTAEVKRPRNPRHHRLYWAILQFLRDHVEMFRGKDTELIGTAVKLATGLVRTFVDQTSGNTVMVPMSISFASMDETRFSQFFDAAVQTISDRWMPGNSPEEIRAELLAMADPMRGAV